MSLRHTCLAILDWIPLHGYALREASRGYAWLHPMTNTNIYPTLRVLEQEGFVVHDDQVVDGRMRKVYRTTDAGRAELHRWLADPTEQPGVYRDPGLLKICLLREGTLRSARDWIRRDLAKIEEGMENARKFLDEREVTDPPIQPAGRPPRRRPRAAARRAAALRIGADRKRHGRGGSGLSGRFPPYRKSSLQTRSGTENPDALRCPPPP